MDEHIGRYAGTIEALVSAGFTIYGNDHRGHGRTAPSAAHFRDSGEGGFDLLVDDMFHLSRIAREENPGTPLILLGTVWVPSPRNNTYSITAGRSPDSLSRGPARSTASLACRPRRQRGKTF